ncbi:MAG: hypothetical protein AMDU2_EPLC00005G0026 [Thermoplasmatales archaeon E-plasma]|jgi:hypothetical protein|nr:MAG: hypothetical protein AMDU2_EPLC00005G0026 [Thermoplasmatales archaeon E-plasma]
MSFTIEISGFRYGDKIPEKFTCDSSDVSPHITWTEAPASTKEFILVMDDPDAPRGTFTHWLIYNIPSTVTELKEGIKQGEKTPEGFYQGKNDFGKIGYNGPCPPRRKTHRYFFTLYAMVKHSGLEPGSSRENVVSTAEKNCIKKVTFMLTYEH